VVGIGGIEMANLPAVKSTGIDGVSLISAILGQEDIENAARNLINLWNAS
jgi:thiamine-phosphate pyrophosphorylase